MDDNKIIELYWQRDESAIAETDKKYGKYCRYIAYQILLDDSDSEEIVNDTYLAAWNAIPPARPDHLKGYVGKISNRLAINRYYSENAQKRGGGQLPLVLDELSECISGSDDDIADGAAITYSINRFLGSLPEKTRNIFVRRYWYASPVSEIAEEYGMRANSITVLLLRTRKKLKEFLEKEGFHI